MFERRFSAIAFLVVATLLTLPAAIAAQSTATQEPSASTSEDPQQPTVGIDINHTSKERVRSDPAVSLTGVGVSGRYQGASPFAVGLRYERLADEGLFGGIEQTLHEVTATGEHRFSEGFLVRAEYRRDASSDPFFPGPLGAADLRRSQPTAPIAAIWVFGSKKGTW